MRLEGSRDGGWGEKELNGDSICGNDDTFDLATSSVKRPTDFRDLSSLFVYSVDLIELSSRRSCAIHSITRSLDHSMELTQ